MQAILSQNYPHQKIDIVFADGGSTDGTINRIELYQANENIHMQILENPLRTAEAGKAVAVRKAMGDIVLLLDSDNIIPDANWLSRMMKPFEEAKIVASEPIEYT